MTLPSERTRSVIQTEDFLKKICVNPEIPESIRNEAKYLLRHFPTADDIKTIGRLEEFLLKPPGDKKREMLISLHMPLFSSKI